MGVRIVELIRLVVASRSYAQNIDRRPSNEQLVEKAHRKDKIYDTDTVHSVAQRRFAPRVWRGAMINPDIERLIVTNDQKHLLVEIVSVSCA